MTTGKKLAFPKTDITCQTATVSETKKVSTAEIPIVYQVEEIQIYTPYSNAVLKTKY